MSSTFVADIGAVRMAFGCMLAGIVLALAVNDLKTMTLPDPLNGMLAAAGIGQSFVLGLPDLRDAALGCLIGSGLLTVLAMLFRRIRGVDALGLGDVKFVAAAGLWVAGKACRCCCASPR